MLCTALREGHRLDLAALVALHLLRAAWRPPGQVSDLKVTSIALELFETYAVDLLQQVEPLLDDPRELVRPAVDLMAIVTYPAMVCRVTELLALVALVTGDSTTEARASRAVQILCKSHPGARRPPSDHFAVSLIPPAVVLLLTDPKLAREYLRGVAQWVIDRHDRKLDGLGLGSIDEDGEDAAARLLAGALTIERPDRGQTSYLATVLLDLLLVTGDDDLFSAVLANLRAVEVVPTIVAADETRARWRRGGSGIHPHPRVDYPKERGTPPAHHSRTTGTDPVIALLLSATARNRHDCAAIANLTSEDCGRGALAWRCG